MLTKYELVNVPVGGVDHYVGGRRWSISATLTNEEADFLINAGLPKYFRLIPQSNVNQKSQSDARRYARSRDASGRFAKS